MSDDLVKRLRGRTTKKLSIDWQVGRDCPECGSMADRPKCLWGYGPSCPRHDPDAYDPPAWDHVADKDCAEAADRIEALTAKNEMLGREVNIARYGQPDFAWSVHVQVMDDLNAKLAKAVDLLTDAIEDESEFETDWNKLTRAFLAEQGENP
jgi:hypothetical protein